MERQIIENIKHVIVHGNCPDGMASAIILYDALGIIPKFVMHGTSEYNNLKAGAIVLDHHKKSQRIIEEFGSRGVFADEKERPGVSGALLAFEEIWTKSKYYYRDNGFKYKFFYDFADLVGIADTWQKDNTRWSQAMYLISALSFYPWSYWKEKMDTEDSSLSQEMMIGKIIYQERLAEAQKYADTVYTFEVANLKVGIFNDLSHLTSDVAEVLRNRGYNLVMGFSYFKNVTDLRPSLRLSLRSDSTFNVSHFANFVDPDGGGHSQAAGCSRPCESVGNDPFLLCQYLLEEYLNHE